jgi:O-antigen/teichoic acid export membrane protein
LVNGLLNPFAVGLYSLAVQIVERLWILSQAVSTVLLPRISELKDDETKRGLITPFISRWVLMITASGSLLLALAAPFLIPLIFGMEFAGSVVALQVILVGITLGSASRILANDIAARGRPELNLYCSVIAILINLVGNLLFIPLMGITGAALATTISYGLNTLMKIYLYARISKIKWYKTIIPEKKDFILLISLIFIRKSANTAP